MDRFEVFLSSINSIYRSIQQIKSAEMEELGLKGTHFLCLYYIGKSPKPLTAAQLSTRCALDKAAVSRILKQLIEKELVVYADQNDKRRYRDTLVLSPYGQTITEVFVKKINRALEKGGQGLDDDTRAIFYHSLLIIKENLEKIVEQGGIL